MSHPVPLRRGRFRADQPDFPAIADPSARLPAMTRAYAEAPATHYRLTAETWAIIAEEYKNGDPPSVWWTPMLAFRSWRGVSDECSTPELSGFFQARGR